LVAALLRLARVTAGHDDSKCNSQGKETFTARVSTIPGNLVDAPGKIYNYM